MCGRFVQTSSPATLAERFGVDEVTVEPRTPNYNVTPRSWVPAVRERPDDDSPARVLTLLRWGLVPSWAKTPAIGDRQINARAESLADRPAYRRAFRKRRCIVPVDAFYEWKAAEPPRSGGSATSRRTPKVPYAIRRRDGDPLAFAGLWEIWRDPGVDDPDAPDAWLRTCAIVTTDANRVIAPIHDRMPVVLAEDAWDPWLDPDNEDVGALSGLLVPAPDEWFEVYEVSTRVNKPTNNDADLLQAVSS
jgi:putative SOS response-associated peptidase YedK